MTKFRLLGTLIPLVTVIVLAGGRSGHGFEFEANWPVPNGSIEVIVSDPGNARVIVGGRFSRLGPFTGGFVGVSPTNAGLVTQGFPKVTGGSVTQIHPDGSGGWILAGGFSAIGGVPRDGLARIASDGSLDPDWAPTVNSGINAIAIRDPLVFIGGTFTEVSGIPRNRIAALSLATGEVADWNPDANATVNCLAVDGTTLYVGGPFSTIGGVSRARLAALDIFSAIPTAWDPSATAGVGSSVNAMLLNGGELLVGGSFTTVGGQTRNRLAAINLATALATAWNPNVIGTVDAMAAVGSSVYIGGSFHTVSGQPRSRIAEVNRSTGAVTAWQPNPNNSVTDLTIDGGSVYAAGTFSTIGGQERTAVAAIDRGTGLASTWDPGIGASQQVYAVQVADDGTVLLGSNQTTFGGAVRNGLASIDISTGELTSWNPDVRGGFVNAAALATDGTLYVGGDFDEIGGIARENIGAINSAGLPTSWNPGADGVVYAIADGGSSIFVGGSFDVAGALTRTDLAEIGKASGIATAWNPSPSSSVWAIVPGLTSVFVGGNFNVIGGQGRDLVAQIDRTSGLATGLDGEAFSPGTVFALALDGSNLIYGGTFKNNEHDSLQLASVNVTTGQPIDWPPFSGIDRIEAIVADGANFLIGGSLSVPTAEGSIAGALALFNPLNGTFSEVDPAFLSPTGTVNAVVKVGTKLVIGGFLFDLDDGRQYLAAYETALPPPAPTPIPQPTAIPTPAPNPTPVPTEKASIRVSGRKKFTTTKMKIVLKGTYSGATRVQYRVGKEKFRLAKATSSNWRATIKLKPGRNAITIRVNGPDGSQSTRVNINRKSR